MLNLKLGLTRADEVMPKLLTQPLNEGGSEGFVPDVDLLLDEYYRERDWDKKNGRPSAAKLAALGLTELD
jgi:aldehyde:ferredoxin oxidoreductase